MSTTQVLRKEVRDGICLFTLNRPDQRNALSAALGLALREGILEADLDDTVRVIAFTGAGTAFCAGADLKESHAAGMRYRGPLRRVERSMFELLMDVTKPTLAIVNGAATAGGCELALACDLRVASTQAWFSLPEAKRGMGANFASVVLPQLIPPTIALDWLLTGRKVELEEAARWGLVNRVLEPGDLIANGLALAADVAASAPLSVRRIRLTYRKSTGMPLHSALRLEVGPDPYESEDRAEGARAFVEKRPAVWKGK